MTSLAEAIEECKSIPRKNHEQALAYFHEALELFNRCLSVQELEFSCIAEENNRSDEILPASQDDAQVAGDLEQEALEEQWVTIVEPVTYNTLIDTVIAQLEALTALCSLMGSHSPTEIQRIEEYYSGNLKDKVMLYGDASGRQHETWLAKARFTCTLNDAAFRLGLVDITGYERELRSSFTWPGLANDPRALCDKADAEVALSSSIGVQLSMLLQSQNLESLNSLRWRYLSFALDDLAAAAKIPNVQNLARVHLRRGDCELLRYQLGREPTCYDRAFRSASVLIKNAGTYYRGAAGLSRSQGEPDEEREATMKEAIAAGLSGDLDKLQGNLRGGGEEAKRAALLETVEDMKEEGLLSNGDATSFMRLSQEAGPHQAHQTRK